MVRRGAEPRAYLLLAMLACCAGTSCSNSQESSEPQAYIAPASVNVRAQLTQRNGTVTVLQHGDRVSLIDVRRRFVKIRTAKGVEGWIDSLDLLSPDEMKRVRNERAAALKLPSEGNAAAYETTNLHLDPNRKSPAFAQIGSGEAVSVLARRITLKAAEVSHNSFAFERPKPPTRKPRKVARNTAKLAPMPSPPKPPMNWQHPWGVDEANEVEAPVAPQTAEKGKGGKAGKGAAPEDWTLVRTGDQRVGWVLSRNLMMSIPDDVAQYAGGRHITSYFDLGAVNDERDGPKHNWLWTTAGSEETSDFDAWRVFLWNRRRHRYETSYRQHDLEGYFPVHVDPADSTALGRSFQLITRDDDDRLRRRTYLFDGVRVHLTATENYPPEENKTGEQNLSAANLKSRSQASWWQRGVSSWKRLWGGAR